MFERTPSALRVEIVEGGEPTTEIRLLKVMNQQLWDENVEGDEPTTKNWQQCNKKK